MLKQRKWNVINKLKVKSEKLKVQELINIILENRGIKTKKEIEQFLSPSLEMVSVDSVGINKNQLKKSLDRIKKAINRKEKIVVFGDYDVDGITGTAILWETLYALGADVSPYIPHRVEEGYGLSVKGVENVKYQMSNIKLIITVDNGIVANDAIDFANKNNIDVIITDHHTIGEKLPEAFSIVHTTSLCGAGVAWILSQNLKSQISNVKKKKDEDEHLDLVALATVADLVPLTGNNRILLKTGLEYLQKTTRIGLKELFKEAQIDPQKIGVYEIGHIIAPRLNAMGRLESAMDSLRLLCTKDKNRAKMLAEKLSKTNRERQLLTQAATLHAMESVKNQKNLKNLLFIVNESYEEGIIGLVAGKLVEQFYRPSIVVSRGEKVSKASARSVSGFNIIEFIREAQDLLINAGGHPMAAGFTIETEKIEKLQEALEKLAEVKVSNDHLTPILKIDCELDLESISKNLYDSLKKLSPFGMGNPEPTFVSKNVNVSDIRFIGREKNHIKFRFLTDQKKTIEAIAFSMADKAREIKIESLINIVYTIDENEWNGETNLQLKIKDFLPLASG